MRSILFNWSSHFERMLTGLDIRFGRLVSEFEGHGGDRWYDINVQTESYDPLELWRHRLFLKSPGE
jgi:hypothetical protein